MRTEHEIPLAAVLVALLLAALMPAARADEFEDPRADRLEAEVRALEAGETAPDAAAERLAALRAERLRSMDDGLLTSRRTHVRMTRDLARADVVLEVHNPTAGELEWVRNVPIDPASRVVAAALVREDADPLPAHTVAAADAERLYQQARITRDINYGTRFPSRPPTWSRPTPNIPRGSSDPLLVERPAPDRLELRVWPVAANETIEVRLVFVTPLAGRGLDRRLVDPIQGDLGRTMPASPGPITPSEDDLAPSAAPAGITMTVEMGDLRLADRPEGLVVLGAAQGALEFGAAAAPTPARPASLPLRARRTAEAAPAITVPGGGIGTRVAAWRFDPLGFLMEQGIEPAPGMDLRLLRDRGATMRIAPHAFALSDEPTLATALVLPFADSLRYVVEVTDAGGDVVARVPVEQALERAEVGPELAGAIEDWHRTRLVDRVLAWAEGDAERRQAALDYAVDVGVLVPGTAALAIPSREQLNLSRRERRLYRHDGAPLGSQGNETDVKMPPPGSTVP